LNIKQAKEQIKNSITAYFTKDEYGNYMIPLEKQRPIYLVGPPGIGKTAIVEQIANEMNVGLLSYSMTHHTRQSALGLPFIEQKSFGGMEYNVSEYTMSEIIASVYDMMEETGIKEGILFLDEINCVSETLAPIMLQFLQYKIFGRHRVPDGWIVVTAGNPPEYNNSVREFDIVTLDRLKKIVIEPDFDAWKEYAYSAGIHPSIMSYLEIDRTEFYSVSTSIDGKTFVTARGWEDLSKIIYLYEMNGIKVDINLIEQYLQERKTAKRFSIYYDLFNKYKSDYQIDSILMGAQDESINARAKEAKFDERLALIGLLINAVTSRMKEVMLDTAALEGLGNRLSGFSNKLVISKKNPKEVIAGLADAVAVDMNNSKAANNLSLDESIIGHKTIKLLMDLSESVNETDSVTDSLKKIKEFYSEKMQQSKKDSSDVIRKTDNMFSFCENVFGEGQEILIIVTEMTINKFSSQFIGRYGCDSYFRHNKSMLFYEREREIDQALNNLSL